jgi:hypothetical protein
MSKSPNIAATSFEWVSFKLHIVPKSDGRQKLELSGKYIISKANSPEMYAMVSIQASENPILCRSPNIILGRASL